MVPDPSSDNLYEVLGVTKDTPVDNIRKVFRQLARKYHPDKRKNKDDDTAFKAIKEAHEVLTNEQRRRMYDETGFTSEEQMMAEQGPPGMHEGFPQGPPSPEGFPPGGMWGPPGMGMPPPPPHCWGMPPAGFEEFLNTDFSEFVDHDDHDDKPRTKGRDQQHQQPHYHDQHQQPHYHDQHQQPHYHDQHQQPHYHDQHQQPHYHDQSHFPGHQQHRGSEPRSRREGRNGQDGRLPHPREHVGGPPREPMGGRMWGMNGFEHPEMHPDPHVHPMFGMHGPVDHHGPPSPPPHHRGGMGRHSWRF